MDRLGCQGGDFLDGDLRRLEKARAAGVTVLTLVHYRVNEIGDVQTESPVHGGLSRFGRDVVAECNRLGIVVDCADASFAATMAALEASSQPVIISHGQLARAGPAHPRLLTTQHVAAVATAGGLIGAWPCGLTSRSLADFGTEIIRLTEVAGIEHVAIGTDLDGNYRPVLTSYHQFADLAGLLRQRGLLAGCVRQVLGGNAAGLLHRQLGLRALGGLAGPGRLAGIGIDPRFGRAGPGQRARGSLGLRIPGALVVPTGLHPVAADGHRAPPGGVGLAAVDQEQAAFVIQARAQPTGTVPGQGVPGENGPDGELAFRRDAEGPGDLPWSTAIRWARSMRVGCHRGPFGSFNSW